MRGDDAVTPEVYSVRKHERLITAECGVKNGVSNRKKFSQILRVRVGEKKQLKVEPFDTLESDFANAEWLAGASLR